jgi:hypothetical protein
MIESSIFTEEAIGKQFRIKRQNKNRSVSLWEIEVLKQGHLSIFIEVLTGGGEIKPTFFGNETWTKVWLPNEDIMEAIPLNQ